MMPSEPSSNAAWSQYDIMKLFGLWVNLVNKKKNIFILPWCMVWMPSCDLL